MLNDSIVLPVDTLNSGVTTDVTFTRYEEQLNRSVYISATHEPGFRDTLAFYRSTPKPTGNFKGVRKTTVKFTADVTVPDAIGGTIDCPSIVEINFSLPIGVSTAYIVALRQKVLALLDIDDVMDKLNVLQMV